jgi:hypothetical protein
MPAILGLLFSVLCAPTLVPGAAAAPQWDYVYFSTATTPDAYPGGAWNQELYLSEPDLITPVNGRLHFNLRNDSLFFYGRDTQIDPRIFASTFTYEWRQEVLSPGLVFSMAMYYAEAPDKWIELIYNGGLTFIADDDSVDLPASLATGLHTYRLVKGDSQVELYVNGALTATMPVGAYTVNYLELSGWGAEEAPYEAYWDHVAYTRGAYTPSELPSPSSSTACVEVPGVPNWKQFNDPANPNTWWDDDYDHTSDKIEKLGCALTAVSESVAKLGFNKNPGELNTLLNKTKGGFDKDSNVNFNLAKTTASLEYKEYYGNDKSGVIQSKLKQGVPVILKLWGLKKREDDTRPPHFVVAVGKCDDTIYINDPGHSSIYAGRPTLTQYLDKLPVDLREIRDIRYFYRK